MPVPTVAKLAMAPPTSVPAGVIWSIWSPSVRKPSSSTNQPAIQKPITTNGASDTRP